MVAQLNLKLDDEHLTALRRYAERRRTPVAWLLKDYIAYLLAGGEPMRPASPAAPTSGELAALAQRGGSFDWLAREPDLYGEDDGEPV